MMQAEGFEVFDLGADVPVDTFIEKAIEVDADLICISALLTTTMVGQKKLIEDLELKAKFEDKEWVDNYFRYFGYGYSYFRNLLWIAIINASQ